MTDPNQPDQHLRARLRAADPAASLPALEPDRITRMVNQTTSSVPSSPTRRRSRRPLVLGVAGAGGLAAAAFAIASLLTPAATAATQLVLPAGDGGLAAGSCPVVNAESLASLPLAFEGTVASLSDTEVTLTVTEVFAGSPAAVVEVERPPASAGDFSAFEFSPGQDYLIAAQAPQGDARGEIALCGLSGPESAELRAVYDAAFR